MENKKFLIIGGGVLLLIIVLVLFLISSCSNKKNNQAGPNTLTVWGYEDDQSAFSQSISDFQNNHKNIKVNYVKKDFSTYLADSLNEIAAGKGPDVWEIPNDWLPKYHDKLVAMPDNKIADSKQKKTDIDIYKETFVPVATQDNIINNKIYGMPMSIDTLVLYYNADIFSNALSTYQLNHEDEDNTEVRDILSIGPANWDQFVRAVRIVTDKSGDKINLSAAAIGTNDNVLESVDILTLLMLQNGAKMTSDDLSTAQFATKQNVFGGTDFPGTKALDFYASFANPNNDNYTWNSSMPDTLHAFAEGTTAMMIGYQSQEQEIQRINKRLNYRIVPVPQIKETKNPINYASYPCFTVTKAAKDSNLSWDFVNFITGHTSVSYYISVTKKTSALLEYINNSSETVPIEAKTAQSWYKPEPAKSDQIFKDMIKQVNDGKNPQTAIENAASQITTLLGQLKQ